MSGGYSGKKGNALRDGYSCEGRRPKSAAPGVLMSEEKADQFDEHSEMMTRYGGGRDAMLHRRFLDKPQNTVPPDDDLDSFF